MFIYSFSKSITMLYARGLWLTLWDRMGEDFFLVLIFHIFSLIEFLLNDTPLLRTTVQISCYTSCRINVLDC